MAGKIQTNQHLVRITIAETQDGEAAVVHLDHYKQRINQTFSRHPDSQGKSGVLMKVIEALRGKIIEPPESIPGNYGAIIREGDRDYYQQGEDWDRSIVSQKFANATKKDFDMAKQRDVELRAQGINFTVTTFFNFDDWFGENDYQRNQTFQNLASSKGIGAAVWRIHHRGVNGHITIIASLMIIETKLCKNTLSVQELLRWICEFKNVAFMGEINNLSGSIHGALKGRIEDLSNPGTAFDPLTIKEK